MGGMALLRMTCSGGSIMPYGRRASTRSSGTKTSSSSMSWLPVPRMPMASQVSSTVDAVGAQGHGHVEHDAALVGVVERGTSST